LDPQFLLVADPSNPNGGALERFAGFETTSGQTVTDPLNLPSLGFVFDNATPSDDYVTNIYSLEYDGFADFPRYPLNFLSDLNAFLGITTLHGTYLNGFEEGHGGPTAEQIANAILLPGSAADGTTDSLTNYYMIDETPPLVALLPQPSMKTSARSMATCAARASPRPTWPGCAALCWLSSHQTHQHLAPATTRCLESTAYAISPRALISPAP
jgi:hypothetical protein